MSYSEPPPEVTELHTAALPPQFRSVPRLAWTDASGAHSVLVEGRMVLGSADGSAIRIDDPTVSRLHAELETRADGLWVRDLGSKNGTFVNELQVTGARVPDGAKIRFGAIEATTDFGGAPKKPIEIWRDTSFGRLIGRSRAMRELFAVLARVSPMDASVLIQGETGTGKELVARAIHDASRRADKPFVVVDCAALPDNLLDAELFGHAKGSFTGAVASREGSIEAADGGTVFLDEIGELPMSMQPKLLRVLESRVVRRIGETSYRPVDVRFISATHRDLLTMVSSGAFREDLYFRLSVLPVTVPPLRERKDDIEILVAHFCKAIGGDVKLRAELLRALGERPWRGNVRELRNFVERALALGPDEALRLLNGASNAAQTEASPALVETPASANVDASDPALFEHAYKEFREMWKDAGDKEYVRRLLLRHDRNVAAAAKEAGIDRTYIYRLIRKHDL
jgi:transcriptional regulator with GAF, ATPase, and Fis domain